MSQQSANKFVSILGLNKALDWILTGRTVNGKEAWECGIANRLVAVGTGNVNIFFGHYISMIQIIHK